jgi:hypothetical protein
MDNSRLFADFIKDFLADKLPVLKDVKPENIEDYKKDFYPVDTDSKHADVVKKITVKDNTLFVIALVEHQSTVDHRMSFRLLVYTTFILLEYEKEAEKAARGITKQKGFTYPPVIPIVYYDGKAEWTAPLDFLYKTKMNDVFHKYIPKFEYELIDLNKYSKEDIISFRDALAFYLLLDKPKSSEDMASLTDDAGEYLKLLGIPDDEKDLFSRIARGMLKKGGVSQELIDEVDEKIKKGGTPAMFEGIVEVFKEQNAQIERAYEEKERAYEEKENLIVGSVKKMYSDGQSEQNIAKWLNLPLERVIEITKSLS